ncbi:hypothetical protein [Nocardioides donggukensis]|uniref:Uncharacterized protein n=1 Tax=Nocardioides donggukensis TaxID=2774019 RepID=A0A927PZD7_9ACTN|nr:hypothetical protein [Nocardioides donggukensis]MBD8869998.1 hypothetical protein [Nocardioides donggukensis]
MQVATLVPLLLDLATAGELAADNHHVIAVNERLGARPIARHLLFRKDLP